MSLSFSLPLPRSLRPDITPSLSLTTHPLVLLLLSLAIRPLPFALPGRRNLTFPVQVPNLHSKGLPLPPAWHVGWAVEKIALAYLLLGVCTALYNLSRTPRSAYAPRNWNISLRSFRPVKPATPRLPSWTEEKPGSPTRTGSSKPTRKQIKGIVGKPLVHAAYLHAISWRLCVTMPTSLPGDWIAPLDLATLVGLAVVVSEVGAELRRVGILLGGNKTTKLQLTLTQRILHALFSLHRIFLILTLLRVAVISSHSMTTIHPAAPVVAEVSVE